MKLLFLILPILIAFQSLNAQNPQKEILDVHHYRFGIELSDSSDIILGEAKIVLELLKELDQFYVDLVKKEKLYGMEVSRVYVNGLPSCFYHKDNKLYVKNNTENWPLRQKMEVRIDYQGIPADGLIISNNKFGNRSFFGDNWPERAHNYLPLIDHPSEKALVSFEITCPEYYDVIASGQLVKVDSLESKRIKHSFESRQEFPSKIMVFAASKFKITSYDSIQGIPVSSWIYSENQTGEMDYAFSSEALEYFSNTIGPYIYQKLANVQSKTRYGGMENAGNIFYFENSVNGRAEFEDQIAHEVAHHWFGNAATEKDWPHIWLSEGFATYLTDLYWEHKYGRVAFQDRLKKERLRVIRYGKKNKVPVVDLEVENLMELLSPNSYEKGAWILHMLRQKTGDPIFFNILRLYYDRYKYGNANSKDFQQIAESVSGQDLNVFFQQWLNYPLNPELDIQWFVENDALYVQVKQKQKKYLFDLKLEIQLEDQDFILAIDGPSKVFRLQASGKMEPLFDPNIKLLFESNEVNAVFDVHKSPVDTVYAMSLEKPGNTNMPKKISIEEKGFVKAGDLLFQDLDCGPLCDAIESVTQGYKGSNFSHVGMVSEVYADSVIVFEAIGGYVKKTRLIDFLKRSKDKNGDPKVMLGRISNQKIIDKALMEIEHYEGKEYDDIFNIENDSYYCSELLYYSFLENGKSIFNLYPMTFKDPNTKDFDPAWIAYYEKLGLPIPEGEPGLNPGGISRSPYIMMIYKFGDPSGYLGNEE